MAKRLGLKVLAISIALVIVASGVAMYGYSGTEGGEGINESGGGGGKGVISLVPPPFIGIAGAAEATGGNAFPEDEAGISAYVNTSQTIDLDKLKTIFTEVEEVGDNYIIGITPISDFGGDIDVHVYANTDGWIVAYFTKDEPAAKIMQWGKDTDVNNPQITEITTTTLEDAIIKAADAAGILWAVKDIKYYDFEYPNANGMTLFVRTRATAGTNITQVEIPADYTLYEASYYHYVTGYSYYGFSTSSKLKVDGTTISDLSISGPHRKWGRAFDSYKEAITTGTLHKIEIAYSSDYSGSAGVATVLIYWTG